MTHVSDLKDDVLNIIFRHLSAEDLVTRVAPVCRHWYALPCLPPPPRSPEPTTLEPHTALCISASMPTASAHWYAATFRAALALGDEQWAPRFRDAGWRFAEGQIPPAVLTDLRASGKA